MIRLQHTYSLLALHNCRCPRYSSKSKWKWLSYVHRYILIVSRLSSYSMPQILMFKTWWKISHVCDHGKHYIHLLTTIHICIYIVACRWFTGDMAEAISISFSSSFSWKWSKWLISSWIILRSSGRSHSHQQRSPVFLGLTVFTSEPEKQSNG